MWAWGANNLGQIGVGINGTGLLADVASPTPIAPFTSLNNVPAFIPAGKIACGATHSMVITVHGDLWTWGAQGRPCLGHNDSPISTSWTTKLAHMSSRPQQHKTKDSLLGSTVPYELLSWVNRWSKPRRIQAAAGDQAQFFATFCLIDGNPGVSFCSVAGGDLHTVGVTVEGDVYMWGEGPAIPACWSELSETSRDNNTNDSALPRRVNSTWLSELSTLHACEALAAGM